MSNYIKYYNERQNAYRTVALTTANLKARSALSESEAQGVSRLLGAVAKRFGLVTEFKKLNII